MVNKQFFVVADAAYGSCSGKTVNLSWHLCRDTGGSLGENVVLIDKDNANSACGAHTVFPDGNNLFIKTFSSTSAGFEALDGTSWCSERIGERYQRKYYRVNVQKASASATPRFVTVIVPCSDASSVSVSASVTGTFSQNSESVSVTVNGQHYNLSASW